VKVTLPDILILRKHEERILTRLESALTLTVAVGFSQGSKQPIPGIVGMIRLRSIVSHLHYDAPKAGLTPELFNITVDPFIVGFQFLLEPLSFASGFQKLCYDLFCGLMFVFILTEANRPH
jgi:hypothetical protein